MSPARRVRRLASAVGIAALAGSTGLVLAVALEPTPWALPLVPVVVLGALLAVRSPLAALVTALVLAPVGLMHLGGALKVAQALDVLVVLCLAVTRLAASRTPVSFPRPLAWGGALLAVALVSTGTAIDTGLAFKQDLALVVGLALAAAVTTICVSVVPWLVAVRALLVGSLLVTVPALFSAKHVQAKYGGSVVNHRPQGIFSQPNELGAFAMLTTLVALGLLLGAARGKDRWLAGAAVTASLAAMLVSLSRGAWIGFVFGVLCLLVWVPRARRLVGASLAGVTLTGALLGAFTPDAPQVKVVTQRLSSLKSAQANPYDDRPRIWREAVREFSSRPLLGEGPGTFPVASTRSISTAATVQAEHAHNVLLTTAAETGLLGLLCVLGLTVSCALTVQRAIRRARADQDRMLLGVLGGLGAAMAGLIGEGLVDVTLRNVLVAQTVWVILGLALAGAALSRQRQHPLADQAEATASSAGVAVPSARTRP